MLNFYLSQSNVEYIFVFKSFVFFNHLLACRFGHEFYSHGESFKGGSPFQKESTFLFGIEYLRDKLRLSVAIYNNNNIIIIIMIIIILLYVFQWMESRTNSRAGSSYHVP